MKTIKTLLVILVAFFAVQNAFAQMKGTEKPLFTDKENECYVFEKFVLINKNLLGNNYQTGEVSQKLEAFKRLSDVSPKESCQKKGDSIFGYESREEVHFVGIDVFKDFIFVDLNYAPDSQKILIFNGLTGKQLFANDSTGWGDRPTGIIKNFYYFDNWTNKEGSAKRCPQARKWKKQGLGVSWIQPYKLDLQTMRKTINGLSYCVSVY